MLFFKEQISNGVKELGESMINNPHDWVQQAYHFRNKKHPDIGIWTANGVSHLQIDGNKGLNSAERDYLNDCIQQSIANRIKRGKE